MKERVERSGSGGSAGSSAGAVEHMSSIDEDKVMLPPACFKDVERQEAAEVRQVGKGERHPEIDWIKAICMVAVVGVHSLPNQFDGIRITLVDEFLGQITTFAVPGFLACSGFLFAGSSKSATWAAVLERLQRLWVPYAVFSAIAWLNGLLWESLGEAPDETPFVEKFVLFGTMGHYYYVMLISSMVLVTPVLARVRRRDLPAIVNLALATHLLIELHVIPLLPLFWHVRNPLRMLGPFALGWYLHGEQDALHRGLGQGGAGRALACAAGFEALVLALWFCLAFLDIFSPVRLAVAWANNYATLAWIYAMAYQTPAPAGVRWISENSYPIYLSHAFFIMPVSNNWAKTAGVFDPGRILTSWLCGLAGSVVFVWTSQRCLGKATARKWLG